MFGIILYDVLFFAIPIILIGLFGISLYRYISAKKHNKKIPGTFSPQEIEKRKLVFIAISVVVGVLSAIVIGFMTLLFTAVAYM